MRDQDRRSRRPILALLTAGAISQVGNAMTAVAVPWFVLQTTGSAAKTGITAAVTVLPPIIAGALGGTLVDRFGFKRTSIAADLASGVTVALVPLLYHTVGLAFWQLLVLMFLGALLDTPGSTARTSLFPDLARLAGLRLERANAASQAVANGAELAGPLLAGILIAALGASNVLWLDALTFAVSALLIAAAVPAVGQARRVGAAAGSYRAALGAGLRFLQRDRLVLTLLLVIAFLNFAISPLFAVVLPVYARTVFGSALDLGLLYAGFAAGTLGVTFGYGAVGHRLPRRTTLLSSLLLTTLPLGALALQPGLPVAVAAVAAAGAISAPITPLLVTLFQERTPAELRGRVFGLMRALTWAAMPAGMLVAGGLLQIAGVRVTLLAETLLFLAVSLSLLLSPALQEMRAAAAEVGARADAGTERGSA